MAVEGIRARMRAELTAEIKRVARQHLAEQGASSLSLRAVARELGVASSAIYRYYPNRDELLTALIVDAFDSLGEAVEDAERATRRQSTRRRWLAICRALRSWALANPHEYGLIYGSPIPGYAAPIDTVRAATRVPIVMTTLLFEIPIASRPEPATIPSALRANMRQLIETLGADIPEDLMVRGLMAWTYVFGAVSFELFGHRSNVVDDHDAFFDYEMDRIAGFAGLV
jgi:AcrR family transcriptional regulator